ncbi:glycosyltransferase [Pseudomonas shirazica]|uniref:glycosyltransferase n=1 Tax=Pseudomonas shirazica TaxID=1940636 RepID=UPI001EDD996F|nr:glycosyltransferase [Pseudomonas shirazica]
MMKPALKHIVFTNFGIGIKDELWLSYRLEIFSNTVLPSLVNQSNQGFEWVIFIDEGLPVLHRARLEMLLSETDLNARTLQVSDYTMVNREIVAIIKSVEEAVLITSRIDDDDCVHEHVIDLLQKEATSESNASEVLLISLKNGLEFLPSDQCYRPVEYETLALALSMVDKSRGAKTRSITQYAHHLVISTLEQQRIPAQHIHLSQEEPLYLYTKHPLSDSYFFGARARILGAPECIKGFDSKLFARFGLQQSRLEYLSQLLRESPLGMPHKYLDKLNTVRQQIRKAQQNPSGTDEEVLNRLLSQKARLELKASRPNPAKGNSRKIRVAILGSSATFNLFKNQRDALERFEICFYMSQSSVISYMAPPCLDSRFNIDTSSADGKRVQWDAKKEHWKQLDQARPDIIIVDFFDESIGIASTGTSVVSASPLMLKTLSRCNIEFTLQAPWSEEAQQLRTWALPAFLDRIASICPNIFVHQATWASQYKCRETVSSFSGTSFEKLIELNNSIIDPMLASLEDSAIPVEKIGGREVGLMAGGVPGWAYAPYHFGTPYYKTVAKQFFAKIIQHVSNNQHKWSHYPYHYHGNYYKTVAKQLLARVTN